MRRKKPPKERKSFIHKFKVGGFEGYLIVGLYDNGEPCEIFIKIAKEGSVISGLLDGLATAVSIGLQYGVPLEVFISKFTNTSFEPCGFTGIPEIGFAKSLLDYIFKYLALKFLTFEKQKKYGLKVQKEQDIGKAINKKSDIEKAKPQQKSQTFKKPSDLIDYQPDAPLCPECGSLMVRNGACYKCENCGATSGCS